MSKLPRDPDLTDGNIRCPLLYQPDFTNCQRSIATAMWVDLVRPNYSVTTDGKPLFHLASSLDTILACFIHETSDARLSPHRHLQKR